MMSEHRHVIPAHIIPARLGAPTVHVIPAPDLVQMWRFIGPSTLSHFDPPQCMHWAVPENNFDRTRRGECLAVVDCHLSLALSTHCPWLPSGLACLPIYLYTPPTGLLTGVRGFTQTFFVQPSFESKLPPTFKKMLGYTPNCSSCRTVQLCAFSRPEDFRDGCSG